MSTGAFVAVIGPSGAGKDTLLSGARAALAKDDRFVFVRRVITRPSGVHEDHDSVSEARFAEMEAAGAFALTWRAHGLAYGVPASTSAAVADGAFAVCNLSRAAVADARRSFARVVTVLVTAPEEALAARLLARGREDSAAVAQRIRREAGVSLGVAADCVVSNDGSREEGWRRFVLCLERMRATVGADVPA
jgi:ribose 1,5-bisphosphokinase